MKFSGAGDSLLARSHGPSSRSPVHGRGSQGAHRFDLPLRPRDTGMAAENAALAQVMVPFRAGNLRSRAQEAVKLDSQQHAAHRRDEVNPGCGPDAARYRGRDGPRGVDAHA